jgi:hypothetical protein
MGKFEGKRQLVRPRSRWENNIEMNIEEVGWGDMDWIDVYQDRDKCLLLVKVVMNLRIP